MKLKDYIQGKRHGEEANRLEREAMNDPFLNDAIDGFDSVEGDHLSVIGELEKQIAGKNRSHKPFVQYMITGIAASMALLIGFSIFMNQENSPAPELVQTEIKDTIRKKEIAQKDLAAQKNKPEVSKIAKETEKQFIQAKKAIPAVPKAIAMAEISIQEEEISEQFINEDKSMSTAHLLTEMEVPVLAAAKPENLATALRTKDLQAANNSKPYIFTGIITDEDGLPLPGVSIQAANSNFGTISDMDGKFKLEIPDTTKTKTLLAKYIGYNPQKIALSSDTQTIRMKPDELALNEVVGVGYGQKRIFNRSTKTTSVDGALQGRVAGLDTNSKKTTFGEREFRKYFEENRRTGICASGEFTLKARFRIDESGKPTNIEILNSDCDELKGEFLRLMEQSPLWRPKNREISITLKIKN
ncbi:MAG: hypothetical protein EOM47_09650 [Bacteroidia bacterium]|nr:hypothetical protein [Bacteroidia bacterium]